MDDKYSKAGLFTVLKEAGRGFIDGSYTKMRQDQQGPQYDARDVARLTVGNLNKTSEFASRRAKWEIQVESRFPGGATDPSKVPPEWRFENWYTDVYGPLPSDYTPSSSYSIGGLVRALG